MKTIWRCLSWVLVSIIAIPLIAQAILAIGKPDRTLAGHSAGVNGLAFSPDGHLLASGSSDNTTSLWELATWQRVAQLKGAIGSVQSVAFSPDGKLLCVAKDRTIQIWHLPTKELRRTCAGHTELVNSAVFAGGGDQVISGSDDGTIRLWDLATGRSEVMIQGESDMVKSIAISPDGKVLASGSGNPSEYPPRAGIVKLWDLRAKKEIRKLVITRGGVLSLAFSPDCSLLAAGSWSWSRDDGGPGNELFGVLKLWELSSANEKASWKVDSGNVWSVAFSPNGRMLASGSGVFSRGGEVRLWDPVGGKLISALGRQNEPIVRVAFSPDSKTLAAGSSLKGEILLWRLHRELPVRNDRQGTGKDR